MNRPALPALLLVALLGLAGCFGAVEPEEPEVIEQPVMLEEPLVEWMTPPSTIELDGTPIILQIKFQGQDWALTPSIVTPTFDQVSAYGWSQTVQGYSLEFLPSMLGNYTVSVSIEPVDQVAIAPIVSSLTHTIEVVEPVAQAPVLNAPVREILEEPNLLWFEGSVEHQDLDTCTMEYSVSDGSSGSISIKEDGSWKVLLDFTEIEDTMTVTTVATCGKFTQLSDTTGTLVMLEGGGADADGDGIQDTTDRCPNGIGEAEGWKSNQNTDKDDDGCRDVDEDDDDDNDGVLDLHDLCPDSLGWISSPDADFDSDGCHDTESDEDDDNDGVLDVDDSCPYGRVGWSSTLYTDWDGDGCLDLDEDNDDDNDGALDEVDLCPKGFTSWLRDTNTDFDDDGCADASEDDDDDNDNVEDVNATGAPLDLCPRTPANATDVDEFGCAAVQRDSDSDGVNDAEDVCEGTPEGLVVNEVGCADIDGDGVSANNDVCPNSPDRWTIDATGCAVVQLPVPWQSASSLNGPLQTVPHFSLPTLDGTFYFQQQWTGYDIYFFLFKYTDSSGNSNSGTWGQSPGPFIRALPDNVHLFFGSFDTTYHNDVINQKASVENALNPDEEQLWADRIHYIDQRAGTLGGGIGDMITSFNNPRYMGIDRFQQARETGSLYAWTSQSNDPMHLIHEPHQWNAEFPVEIRRSDPAIEEVTLWDFDRHSGGWGGGFTSAQSAEFPSNLTTYDTLEVYHEHACDERSNRYQKSDGSYGGCHEWDYEANLRICDRDNASSCGTEFMRWITTYGREGKWLTDISPYLFMLENDDNRTFKYRGANKGDLTITLLFSDWGSGERGDDATFAFTGGQFDGTYNDESIYTRQLNFTVPSWASRVEIVATITGHGFGQDNANCAEFCDHEHHYSMNGYSTYEWHPIVSSSEGCENEVSNGVVANQFGSWPFGRAGWCAGQDVKQWTYDITSWVDSTGANNHLTYQGLYNGQEYVPSDGIGNGQRNIHAEIWIVFYNSTDIE
ncbi:MAG: peptide-N-glycosidase F-related protein [Candidatus Poseidoniaceae archaeon]|nr:peptide-N-glycosidase F-related protein [Candidatus Poseidoniaceae archaeon]